MDRLAALFEQLPLPEIARLLRRTVFCALGLGVVALVLSLVLNYPFAGLGACIGLALGLVNIRLVVNSVHKVNESGTDRPKRVLATRSLYRLALTTIIVIGLALAKTQLGIGTAGGIAVFYFLLVANLLRSILAPSNGTKRAPV